MLHVGPFRKGTVDYDDTEKNVFETANQKEIMNLEIRTSSFQEQVKGSSGLKILSTRLMPFYHTSSVL